MTRDSAASAGRVLVWDPLVRVTHWGIALACLANLSFLRNADEPHEIAGYLALALAVLRIAWGFVGSRHARFADFAPGPARLIGYMKLILRRREPRYLGHNPAGAVMMLLLLALACLCGVSGWMMGLDRFWGETWVEVLHESAANAILVCAAIHVAGAVTESLRHRENLVLAMITGRKRAAQGDDVAHAPPERRR